jgi:hypothetical protein
MVSRPETDMSSQATPLFRDSNRHYPLAPTGATPPFRGERVRVCMRMSMSVHVCLYLCVGVSKRVSVHYVCCVCGCVYMCVCFVPSHPAPLRQTSAVPLTSPHTSHPCRDTGPCVTPSGAVVLQSYYSGVKVVVEWCSVMLQWCYRGVTVVLQWCYSGVTAVLQRDILVVTFGLV